MANNLFIKLIAMLNRALSRKQISRDVVDLEKTPFYVRLTGKLNKNKTIGLGPKGTAITECTSSRL